MRINRVKQVLKAFSDDTRMRIVNLLNRQELNVADLCRIIGKNQSNVSKHLARLRLLGIVSDKRKGLNVYYYLPKSDDKVLRDLLRVITKDFTELPIFKKDLGKLKKLR